MTQKINFKNKFSYYIGLLLFIGLVHLYFKHNGQMDSTISEWLINYQGGFSRRGLLGEIFFQLSLFFEIKIRFIIFLFQAAIYGTFLILSYNFFKDLKHNYITLLALFSPLLFIYHVAELEVLGRKEVLAFVHCLILINFLSFDLKKYAKYFFMMTYPILILVWEPIIFFSGFYLVILLAHEKIDNFYELFKKSLFLLTPAILVALFIITNDYTTAKQVKMCLALQSIGERCYMSLGFVTTSIKENYSILFNQIKIVHIFRYIVGLSIGFYPLFLIMKNIKKEKKIKNKVLYKINFVNLFFAVSSPIIVLYAMGLDWGRWSNIYYFYSIAMVFYLIKYNYVSINYFPIKAFLEKISLRKNYLLIFYFIILAGTWNFKTLFKGDIASLPMYRVPYKFIKMFLLN